MDIYVGIVGSRRRNTLTDRDLIFNLLKRLKETYEPEHRLWVVSGRCKTGADAFAEEAARILDLGYACFPVQTDPPIPHRGEYARRAYARNRLIAEHSWILFALCAPDRTGGTENTIGHMFQLGKDSYNCPTGGDWELVTPSDGRRPRDPDETGAPPAQVPARRKKGTAPHR